MTMNTQWMTRFKSMTFHLRWIALGVVSSLVCTLVSEPRLVAIAQEKPTPSNTTPKAPEAEVLVNEVVIEGVSDSLKEAVSQAIATQAGKTTTRSKLQEDINAIFATGWFSTVKAEPKDTPKGVRVTFIVQANPVLRQVNLITTSKGKVFIPSTVTDNFFRSHYGKVVNYKTLNAEVQKINKWYQENGYILAQIAELPKISEDGVIGSISPLQCV